MGTNTASPIRLRVPPDLESLRKQRGITLREIADDTKININYLRAIEEGRFEKLPGGIYNVSYIRQYARAIDFDESELLAYYKASTGLTGGEAPEPAPKKSTLQLLMQTAFRRGLT